MNLNFSLQNNLGSNFENNFYLVVEKFLINFSFLILLITTLYYWINFILFYSQETKNNQLKSKNFGFFGLLIVNVTIFFQLSLRWIQSGHFPLSNLYDSLLFLAWGLLFVFICLEWITKLDILGIIISPTILCIIAFTDFSLPEELQKLKPLVPALQSNWLFMHVSVMIFSYAALIIGCLLSISFLFYFYYLNNFSYLLFGSISDNEKQVKITTFSTDSKENNFNKQSISVSYLQKYNSELPLENVEGISKQLTRLDLLDNLSYRLIGIGFCFLTLGILSGAIWANETWGTYWSWDPKETWALITWLIFAIYLHTRLINGFQGIKSAWIAFCGFFILWICYLGVNLLGEGLHSYGFLDS